MYRKHVFYRRSFALSVFVFLATLAQVSAQPQPPAPTGGIGVRTTALYGSRFEGSGALGSGWAAGIWLQSHYPLQDVLAFGMDVGYLSASVKSGFLEAGSNSGSNYSALIWSPFVGGRVPIGRDWTLHLGVKFNQLNLIDAPKPNDLPGYAKGWGGYVGVKKGPFMVKVEQVSAKGKVWGGAQVVGSGYSYTDMGGWAVQLAWIRSDL